MQVGDRNNGGGALAEEVGEFGHFMGGQSGYGLCFGWHAVCYVNGCVVSLNNSGILDAPTDRSRGARCDDACRVV